MYTMTKCGQALLATIWCGPSASSQLTRQRPYGQVSIVAFCVLTKPKSNL